MSQRAEYCSIFPAVPRTERGFFSVLSGDPKGENFLYCHGNTVFIRNIEDPTKCELYTEHATQVNVAKYSPSRFYIASGDEAGKIRIWDTTQKEHILKNEFQPFGGPVKDLAWSPDNQRIVAVGEGKESFASVFLFDTGTTTGNIMGHSKTINSCDFKSSRPFRICTGSEDMTVSIHEGPPFKFKSSMRDHSNFVQCTRFSPDGQVFVSASADKRILVWDGKEGELKGELKDGATAHGGSVYQVCFSPSGSQLLSVSADKTAKIWDMGSLSLVTKFEMGKDVGDMQVGCLWQGDHIISLSLSGCLSYLDKNNPTSPLRVVRGHNKKITCMAACVSGEGTRLYSGDFMGNVFVWDAASGIAKLVTGGSCKTQIIKAAVRKATNDVILVSVDDNIRFVDMESNTFVGEPIKCPSQPQRLASSAGKSSVAVVGCQSHLLVLQGQNVLSTLNLSGYQCRSVALHPEEIQVAVSCDDNKVRFFELSASGTLSAAQGEISVSSGPLDVSWSPDGAHIAVSDNSRVIRVFPSSSVSAAGDSKASKCELCYHTAKITCFQWHNDSTRIVSGSLDTNLLVWNINTPNKFTKIMQAHPKSSVTDVAWVAEDKVVSSGFDDCNLKMWDVNNF